MNQSKDSEPEDKNSKASEQDHSEPIENTEQPTSDPDKQEDNDDAPAAPAQSDVPAETKSENADAKAEKSKITIKISKKKLIIVGIALVLIIGAVVGFFAFRKPKATEQSQSTTVQEKPKEAPKIADNLVKDTPSDLVTIPSVWLGTPKTIDKISIFTDKAVSDYVASISGDPSGQPDTSKLVTYTQLGTSKGNRIIAVSFKGESTGDYYVSLVFLEKKLNKEYVLLKQHSYLFGDDGKYQGPDLGSKVTISEKEQLEGFAIQDTITTRGAKLQRTSNWFFSDKQSSFSPIDTASYTELEKTEYGPILEHIVGDGTDGVKSYYLLLKQPSGTFVQYRYIINELKDDYSLPVSWNDGSSTSDKYRWDEARGGCGFGYGVNVVAKQYHKDLVKKGKVGNKDVYEFNSATHPVVTKIYDAYATTNTDKVSQADYVKNHGTIVVKNEFSYYVILANTKYVSAGECAKPVIYLYPQTPTNIHVSVEADVTKSDPLYNNGWNVLAMPNGDLLTGGKKYKSLFWDGLGHGQYPDITSGTIVKRQDVKSTITSQLKTMGLNKTETNDFLEYWMPLMPNTNYVRLTWFDTQTMNQLAPLHLSVTPDTLIRVFLDFKGLDKPADIQPQQIQTNQRKGFTVVEWGGLKVKN